MSSDKNNSGSGWGWGIVGAIVGVLADEGLVARPGIKKAFNEGYNRGYWSRQPEIDKLTSSNSYLQASNESKNTEIRSLKSEIEKLKKIIEDSSRKN